ncbi:MAG: histidinol-phosphate transaminase [Verrucomicrobiales bacterium]
MALPLPLNPALQTLPTYQPGRPIEEVAREHGLPVESIIKLASNENPLGPSPKAVAAMQQVLAQLHLYPDGNAFYLKRKLAEKLGAQPGNLVLGNGSNEIIEFVGHALMRPGVDVLVSEYCFAIYPIIAKLFGANIISVPAKAFGHDLEAMARAMTPNTKVIFIANPNNPTGTLASNEEILAFIKSAPKDALVVMDEAYIEFLDKPLDLAPSVAKGEYPNVLLMRTFSKIFGLAGLRLGYGIGHPELISNLEKVRQPFNINAIVQAGALAALDDVEHIDKTRRNNQEGLAFLEQSLEKLNLPYVRSYANFILVKTGQGQSFFNELQRLGVITRPMGGYGLPDWIRISIGSPQENQKCMMALEQVLPRLRTASPA